MANRIQIRHGSSTPTTSNLLPYELGWDSSTSTLYINNNGTIQPVISAEVNTTTETLTLKLGVTITPQS